MRISRVTGALLLVSLALLVLSLAGQIVRHFLGFGNLLGLIDLFDVRTDVTIPTWWSSFVLLAGAVIFFAIASESRSNSDRSMARGWALAAAVLLVFSVDEVAAAHERVIAGLRMRFNSGGGSGVEAGLWLGFGGLVILGLGLVFGTFLRRLPSRTWRWLIVAGVVFFGGAVGMEALSTIVRKASGADSFPVQVISTIEEGMEMVGAVLAVHAGMLHLTRNRRDRSITLRFVADVSGARAGAPAGAPRESVIPQVELEGVGQPGPR